MAIRATSLEREPSALLNYDGRYDVYKENINHDPVFEAVRRSQPVFIGPRTKTDLNAIKQVNNEVDVDYVAKNEQDLPGGKHFITHSERFRQLELIAEDGDRLTFMISNNTRTYQVRNTIGAYLATDPRGLEFVAKVGPYWKSQQENSEIPSCVKVKGCKTFSRPRQEYTHPIMIMGAGFGGMVTAMKLLQRGRKDIQMFEKLPDFGGGSWFHIANKSTKLQTEAGSYHLEFFFQELGFPGDMPTWPSRDHLLMMFSRGGRKFGLHDHTLFNTKITKIVQKGSNNRGNKWFAVYHETVNVEEPECEVFQAGAALCWPGNLCTHKIDEYPGEDVFGGYIEYASLNMPDYTKVQEKVVVIVGHGAFAIENVRTALEFDCAKMTVVCRRRNITAPKPVSWLVTQHPIPVPGPVMMEALCDGYKLIEWDPWTAYSVTTDAKRSRCRIDQGTMFGVTDVYFAAGYYGLMDVVVGDVKKLTYQCMHLKTGKKVPCEVILKTVGVRGDYETDKILGLKELVGYWVNGDPLYPAITNTLFVQASNFAGFSIGPGLAGEVESILWFVDHPQDFEIIRNMLPKHNKDNSVIKGNALYVYSAAHSAATGIMMSQVPGLDLSSNIAGALKHTKQRIAHPTEQFLEECISEWEMYVDMCLANPNCRRDKPRPPYPYTKESLERYMWLSDTWNSQ